MAITFATGLTLIRLLLGVCHLVSAKLSWPLEHFPADVTSVVSFSKGRKFFFSLHHLLTFGGLTAGSSDYVNVILRVTGVAPPTVAL